MKITDTGSIIEVLKKSLEKTNTSNAFPPAAIELAALYEKYHAVLQDINRVKNMLAKENSSAEERVDSLEKLLLNGINSIIEAIEYIINRGIVIHITDKNDCLLKIARKYNSDIHEVVELNRIKKLFSITENTLVLVPVKFMKD